MISLSPDDRLSADKYLEEYRDSAFPSSFYTFYYPFFQNINQVPAQPFPISTTYQQSTVSAANSSSGTSTPLQGAPALNPSLAFSGGTYTQSVNNPAPFGALPTNADERIDRIWADFERVIETFGGDPDICSGDSDLPQFPKPNTDVCHLSTI